MMLSALLELALAYLDEENWKPQRHELGHASQREGSWQEHQAPRSEVQPARRSLRTEGGHEDLVGAKHRAASNADAHFAAWRPLRVPPAALANAPVAADIADFGS